MPKSTAKEIISISSFFIAKVFPFVILFFFVLISNALALEDSLCATVKIEIAQELTLERQAFDAHMRINNNLPDTNLTNIKIEVNFSDEDGNSVLATTDPNNTAAKFFLRVSSKKNVEDISGSGIVSASTSADINWLIIPSAGAGSNVPEGKLYYVGAALYYSVNGEEKQIDVMPDYIKVRPLPELMLDYFLPNEVYGDDPFTEEIEPVIPFTLGVRVKNSGASAASNVKIDSAQPKIVDNKLGLLVNFWITQSWINEQLSSNSLLINFEDIPAGTSKMGRWIMEASLSGKFTLFEASFSHSDELGGQVTSLINSLNTHTLIWDVLVDLSGRDQIRDFLGYDAGIYKIYESDNIDSEVYDKSSEAKLEFKSSSSGSEIYTLTFTSTTGFVYAKVADPFSGDKVIGQITRSDGKYIRTENAWFSKTRIKETQSWEYYFNLFDADSTGSYTIQFADKTSVNQSPVLDFISDKTGMEKKQLLFSIKASDPDGTIPDVFASPLPAGATFVDNGDGTGKFDWTPLEGQAGTYEVKFRASDGILEDSQIVKLTINTFVLNPDFSLTISPAARTIEQGKTTDYNLEIASIDGFDSSVSLTPAVTPLPAKGAISFGILSPVTPSTQVDLTVNTTDDTEIGNYTISIRGEAGTPGEAGNKTHTVSSELIIEEKFDITNVSLSNSRVGNSYNAQLSAKGGTAPYTWSISQGSLPDGLTLNAANGVISGTLQQRGYFIFTVEVKDSSNSNLLSQHRESEGIKYADKEFSIIVWPLPQEAFGEGALLKVNESAGGPTGEVALFKDGYREVYSFAEAKLNNTAINFVFGLNTPFIKFPIYKGDEWTVDNVSYEGHTAVVKFKVLNIEEEVVVPAGTFKDCVKLRQTIDFTDSRPADFPNTIIRWFAPKTGIVKTQIYWNDNTLSNGELKEYFVAAPKNNDYFPLKKDNYWTFEWDKYKSINQFTEKYIVADLDSNIITERLKKPWVSVDDLFPYPGQGKTDEIRVPCDSSIIARVKASLGLNEDKFSMLIKTGGQFYTINPLIKQAGLGKADDYWVSFNKPSGISTQISGNTLIDSGVDWVAGSLIGMRLNPNIKHKETFSIIDNTATSISADSDLSLYANTGDAYRVTFAHRNTVDVEVNAEDVSESEMDIYSYSFKTETSAQHNKARNEIPDSKLDTSNSEEYVLSVDEESEIKGAKIKYNPKEVIAPAFGPLEEIPDLDIAIGAGIPLNLGPAVIFNKPVTIFVPCPGVVDLGFLEIYGYQPALGWRKASEIDGWMMPHSRVDHAETAIPSIELKVYHFTGIQAGKPLNSVSVYADNATFEGKNKNSFSADIKRDFINDSITGYVKFQGKHKKSTINMESTEINQVKRGSEGEVIIKGDCKLSGKAGYSFTCKMEDEEHDDEFSIEITGPNDFKFSDSTEKLKSGDIQIIWQ